MSFPNSRWFVVVLFLLMVGGLSASQDPASETTSAVPAAPVESGAVTIVAVGDMMIGNWGEELVGKNGPEYPFRKVADYLQQADIATGNLEGPHCSQGQAMKKKYTFRMKPEHLAGYRWAGFDVLTVGNNHAMDFGADCFLETLENLKKGGMAACGGGPNLAKANSPAVVERKGIRVAFLGYSATYPKEAWATPSRPGTVFPERSRLINAVSKAASSNDLLVVHFHWGGEGRQDPKDYQKDLAHLAIDNGADLVIGHHPHVLQGVESYQGRLIFYSLGNFTFASYSQRARTSALVQVTLDRKGNLVRGQVVPLNVYNYEVHLQPVPLPGDPVILGEIRKISGMIGTGKAAIIEKDGAIRIP